MDNGGLIIMGFVLGFCAIIIITLGIIQYRNKKPSGFYTGETIDPTEISDVTAWNHKHGIMWILYGSLFPILFIVDLFIKSPLVFGFLFIGMCLVPIPFMVMYHHHLLKKYKIK